MRSRPGKQMADDTSHHALFFYYFTGRVSESFDVYFYLSVFQFMPVKGGCTNIKSCLVFAEAKVF